MAKKIMKSETPVETPVPVVDPSVAVDDNVVVVDDKVVASVDSVVSDKFDVISTKVNDVAASLRDLQLHLKTVQKELVKLVKANVKKTKSRTSTSVKKTPSGFAKPTKLSDALCDFLGIPSGTELARTEVTRRLNAYIKENNLQDATDRRKIHPDEKLSKVLTMQEGDTLSFFNLQSHIKSNFLKA
jgi:chromatin remodeling complex protein RSC6